MTPHRIPLHDHADGNSGGRLAPQATAATAAAASGSSGSFANHEMLHEHGGADALPIENLGTADTTTTDVLKPDGSGGVAFGAIPGATPSGGYGTAAAGSAATALLSDAVFPKPTAPDVDFSADVTDNDATAGHHGLLPKLDGGSIKFLREDGTWQLVGASSTTVFRGCRAYHSSLQSVNSGQYTGLLLDSEDFDTDSFHFTSGAALTGTVQKTAGSAAIAGTGTSFTTELSVNQVISIPGTATEYGVVKTITDNTHLTLWQNMANNASGQTATRRNDSVGIPAGLGGYYLCIGQTTWAFSASGLRNVLIGQNSAPSGGSGFPTIGAGFAGGPPDPSSDMTINGSGILLLAEGDFITLMGRQLSGVAKNAGSSARPAASMLSVTRLG